MRGFLQIPRGQEVSASLQCSSSIKLKKLPILDKKIIFHQDLLLLLNQLEFKGNKDRFHQISVDSTDALPKAKAKVIIQKPKMQLSGRVQPISVPDVKFIEQEEDDYHDPQPSSSNDPSIPLPMITPTSFMPGNFSQPDQNSSLQGTPELVPAQDDDDQTEPYTMMITLLF